MDKEVVSDIVEWDSVNWAKCLDFIDNAGIEFRGRRVLALGEHNGGMSLFFALKGADVLCSDIFGPTEKAHFLHEKYDVASSVRYAAIDAVNIPEEYNGQFDVVTFKSVLGGIGRNKNYRAEEQSVCSIYRVLTNGGYCIFCENMHGSFMHMFLRERFSPCGRIWHYGTDIEIKSLFEKYNFCLIESRKFGMLGTLGRSESQRRFLGRLDTMIFDKLLPDTSKYIGAYIFQKQDKG